MDKNTIMNVTFGDKKLIIGHKDKMGNLNQLVEIGNDYRFKKGSSPMRLGNILELKGIKEYIVMLENKYNSNLPNFSKLEITELKNVRHMLKTRRGKYGGSFGHLNILVRIAIEMNPEFADDVISTFIEGRLLLYRDIAGDDFKILSAAIKIFNPDVRQRMRMAKGLNYIVFKKHYTDMRKDATSSELKELVDIQNKLSFAIDMGYIKTFEQLIVEMLKMYHKKWSYDKIN